MEAVAANDLGNLRAAVGSDDQAGDGMAVNLAECLDRLDAGGSAVQVEVGNDDIGTAPGTGEIERRRPPIDGSVSVGGLLGDTAVLGAGKR